MKTFHKSILIFLSASVISFLLSAEDNKTAPPDQQISSCIASLGSEEFKTREESQAKLQEIGKTQYDLVLKKSIDAYAGNKDPEVRLRLKNVLRTIVTEKNFRKKGFIGISMSNSLVVLKIGDATYNPIEIVNVMPDLPADKNGFMTGDKILKVDDNACSMNFNSNGVVEYISAKKPGTRVTFLLQSGDNTVTKEVEITERPDLPNEPSAEQQKDDFFTKWFKGNVASPVKQQQQEGTP
ncbi:MAG: PDZ domain-containing protein [Victivallales bacterium]